MIGRDSSRDVDILLTFDALQSDDSLLVIMWKALQTSKYLPEDLTRFIRTSLAHRLNCDPNIKALDPLLQRNVLPLSTYSTYMEMVVDMLDAQFHVLLQTWTLHNSGSARLVWLEDCVFLLSSNNTHRHSLSERARQSFRRYLGEPTTLIAIAHHMQHISDVLGSSTPRYLSVVQTMEGGLLALDPESLYGALRQLLLLPLSDCEPEPDVSPVPLWAAAASVAAGICMVLPDWNVNEAYWPTIVGITTAYLKPRIAEIAGGKWTDYDYRLLGEAFEGAFRDRKEAQSVAHRSVIELVRCMLLAPRASSSMLIYQEAFGGSRKVRSYTNSGFNFLMLLLHDAFTAANIKGKTV